MQDGLAGLIAQGFDIAERNHAAAILTRDFPDQTAELEAILAAFRLPSDELLASGGGQAKSTMRLRDDLVAQGWRKHKFIVQTIVDGVERESISHEVDHVRRVGPAKLALEIEWNNKDPFFDRDLENFQRLHALGAISVGIVVTRGAMLQRHMKPIVLASLERRGITRDTDLESSPLKPRTPRQRQKVAQAMASGASFAEAFASVFVNDKFGPSTTHWDKLITRVKRGVGNPCPLLMVGLPLGAVPDYSAATPELKA